ncbi:hypothetical protein HYFRA_00001574 [Hymenoscyphus fraxineus]|uniref:Uncharacterized protein n=1 Tax=Hymenoscyphus fraxineus TaxID=746836 RepID=A0A9N9L8I8_9HELO|nr:hypothetical protein HYFRA_00001574 [Hymenoscyphus fraxineus]
MARGKHTEKSAARIARRKPASVRRAEHARICAQRNATAASSGYRPSPPSISTLEDSSPSSEVSWCSILAKWLFVAPSSEPSHWLEGDTGKEWKTSSSLCKTLYEASAKVE